MKLSLFLIFLTATMPAFAGWFERPPARKIVIMNNGKEYVVDEADSLSNSGFRCVAGTPIHRLDDQGSNHFSRIVLNGSCHIKGAKP
jgi:hypothetical protein